MRGALLVAGTSSDVGKSLVVAGICRWLSRQGVSVAPFKAQNMSLNSAVTPDGAEIGRAQAAQAAAARVPPEAVMNPVLLKPAGERSSQVVVMGRPVGVADARFFQGPRREILRTVLGALHSLRERFDVVICEGAGSIAEINLREGDIVNMGLARAAQLPVLVVADIDRGGAFAGLFGSLALLDRGDQDLIAGFLLNKFRGDRDLLMPALNRLSELTGRPFLGVLPWAGRLGVDAEDSLALHAPARESAPPLGRDGLSVAVVRLPRISNFTDFDPLTAEPGVTVAFTESPQDIIRADVAVLPGTKSTVEDLRWLRARELDQALRVRAERGHPLVGICGGYQMLGVRIEDEVESGAGQTVGLGLLPVETVFGPDKVLANRTGWAPSFSGTEATGYEIRHGRVQRAGGEPLFATAEGDEGCRIGTVVGTSWHGVFEADSFRRSFLRWTAEVRSLDWIAGSRPFSEVREAHLDLLGNLIERHSDTKMLGRLISGVPAGLPFVATGIHGQQAPPSLTRTTASPPDLALRFGPHGDRMVPEGTLDFAVSVVPRGPPAWLRQRLREALDRASSYPDESEAIRAVSDRYGRRPEEVLLTNGASEAFWLLAAAMRPRHAVVVHPAFTEPDTALTAMGHRVDRALRGAEDFCLDVDVIADDADLMIIGNPNNPTGNLESAAVLGRLARPGRVFVVDEAFMDFSLGEPESLAPRSDLPGVVVVRSLTKVWSLPGIRAGFLLGPPEILESLRAVRQPWSVNTLACALIAACVGDRSSLQKLAEEVDGARKVLTSRLAELPGVRVWPSAANYVLIRVPDGPRVRTALLDRGVAVRPVGTFPGLHAGHLRIAVRTPAENEILLAALREVLP
ncbi:MAG: cobyric acid synthase [Actinomycetota bacterium]